MSFTEVLRFLFAKRALRVVALAVSLMLAAAALASNPILEAGGGVTLPATGSDPDGQGLVWDVVLNGQTIATSQNANGWSVLIFIDVQTGLYNFSINAPGNAGVGTNYEVRSGGPPNHSAFFNVVPTGTLARDTQPQSWQDDNQSSDSMDSGGEGGSYADSTNLTSGVQSRSPNPDIAAYNPNGPSASYQRKYRSWLSLRGLSAPGLTSGWFDSYSYNFQPGVNSFVLSQPNGTRATFTATSLSGTVRHLVGPLSSPFAVDAFYPTSSSGTADYLIATFKDLTTWKFTPFAGTYRLTKVANIAGHYNAVNYDSVNAYRLSSVVSDASVTLLLFNYTSGLLSSIDSSEGTSVYYTYGQSAGATTLIGVSQVVPTGTSSPPAQWQYGYTAIFGEPFLSSVGAPDPSNGGAIVSHPISYDPATGATALSTDANGNQRIYGYLSGSTTVTIKDNLGQTLLAWSALHNLTGFVTGYTDANGKTASVAYSDPSNPNLPTGLTNRNQQTIHKTYDAFGNVLTATDLREVVTAYVYDYTISRAGLLLSVQIGSKTATTYEYFPTGQLFRVHTPTPGTTGGPTLVSKEYAYTSLGDIASVKVLNSAGAQVTYGYNYTQDGTYFQGERVGQPLTVTDPLSHVTHYRYDGRGNVTQVTHEVGNATGYTYTDSGQLDTIILPATGQTGSGNGREVFIYDHIGGTLTQKRVLDENGNLVQTINYPHGKEADSKGVTGNLIPETVTRDAAYRVAKTTER